MREKHYDSAIAEGGVAGRAFAFGESWLMIAGAVVLLAGLAGQAPLVLLGVLTLVTIGAARYWNDHSLDDIEYRRALGETRVFPGETVVLRLAIANKKLLPVPFVEIEDELPPEIEATLGQRVETHRPNTFALLNSTSLLWWERVAWRYELTAKRRGYYRVGPARLRAGDAFGFFRREILLAERPAAKAQVHATQSANVTPSAGSTPVAPTTETWLVVYPTLVPLSRLGLPARNPLGDLKSAQRIFEDPTRVIGVRDYSREDSFKRIHWKASARRPVDRVAAVGPTADHNGAGALQLQVKVYEPTTTPSALLFMNIDTFAYRFQGYDAAVLEATITAAASVAAWLIEQKHAVGLYVNATTPGSDQNIKLAPKRDADQLGRILEALAKLAPISTQAFDELVLAESGRLPWGATIVVCTGYVSDALAATLQRLRSRGHQVALLYLGETSLGDGLRGIHRVELLDSALQAIGVAPPSKTNAEPAEIRLSVTR